jgi:hypothetical protein
MLTAFWNSPLAQSIEAQFFILRQEAGRFQAQAANEPFLQALSFCNHPFDVVAESMAFAISSVVNV